MGIDKGWGLEVVVVAPADEQSWVGRAMTRHGELTARRVEGLDRIERNRDMWKGQCERQAERLTVLNRAVSEISRGVQSGVDPQVSIDRLVKIARSAAEPVADTEAPTTEGTALKEKPQ